MNIQKGPGRLLCPTLYRDSLHTDISPLHNKTTLSKKTVCHFIHLIILLLFYTLLMFQPTPNLQLQTRNTTMQSKPINLNCTKLKQNNNKL